MLMLKQLLQNALVKSKIFFSPAISFWLEQFEPLIGFSVFCLETRIVKPITPKFARSLFYTLLI